MKLRVWPVRRLVQLLAIAVLVLLPISARYQHYLTSRQVEKLEQKWQETAQGAMLGTADRLLRAGIPDGESGVPTRRPRKAMLERAHAFYGSPWSARLFGVSFTDLLAGAESFCASHGGTAVLLVGLAIPLIATLLLGRVFCSWICPMGWVFEITHKLRALLGFLELPPLKVRFWNANKYVLLGVGLAAGALVGLPLLHYVYPPAVLSREVHTWIMTQFDRAEAGRFGLALAGLTGGTLFLLAIAILEIAVAPRFWCSTLCPGAAVYALVGGLRAVRVRRNIATCTKCGECDVACPMALHPMTDRTGLECDNCGICIDVCPEDSLGYKLSLSSAGFVPRASVTATTLPSTPPPSSVKAAALATFVVGLLGGAAGVAHAHHIIGIPHYAYDDSYPQKPVLKLREQVGDWELQLTSYPGNPVPGERTVIHAYVRAERTKAVYRLPVTLEVFLQPAFGSRERVFGPEASSGDENMFKYQPVYPAVGNYEVVLSFQDGAVVSTMRFPMVVGEPGSPWTGLLFYAGGFAVFVIVVRAIRIKRARRATAGSPARREDHAAGEASAADASGPALTCDRLPSHPESGEASSGDHPPSHPESGEASAA